MGKMIKSGIEAREAMLEGAAVLADAVGSTLGPKATNVAIARQWGPPIVLQDGVSVAREIDLSEPFANMGVQLLKEAASRTNDAAGDGTTTSIVLGHAIAAEAHKNIVAGANPMMLRRGIEAAVDAMEEELFRIAVPVDGKDGVLQVASISAQNEEIGALVSEGIGRMGKDGVLAVEESGSRDTYLEIKEGMEFARGWLSPYFVTNPELAEAVLENPYVLVTDMRLTNVQDVIGFMSAFAKAETRNKTILVIAEDVSGEALQFMALNKVKGSLNILAVKAPGFGERQKDMLRDIATVTGSRYFSTDTGSKLSEDTFLVSDLGSAGKVVSTEKNTVIVDGGGRKEDIESRIAGLRASADKSETDFDREKLQERIARLTTGVGIIYVGASSETEMRERKERFIDAISAAKASMEQGIVPGGETALYRASLSLSKLGETGDAALGVNLVRRAAERPFRKLMANAGYDEGRMVAALEAVAKKKNWGIDVIDGQAKDLVSAGIIDPVKVTIHALRNAASCAVMILTTNVLVVSEPERKNQYPEG